MFIPVPALMLRSQDYDSCLRFACDELSKRGIRNFIHYMPTRIVELYDPARMMMVMIDYEKSGIVFITQ